MTTQEYIQFASERQELCEKISLVTSIEEAYAIAEECGVTDDLKTFTAVMKAARAELDGLSDEDLENVTAAGTATVADIIVTACSVVTATCYAIPAAV